MWVVVHLMQVGKFNGLRVLVKRCATEPSVPLTCICTRTLCFFRVFFMRIFIGFFTHILHVFYA
jgi:hypothetical protein